MNAITKLQAWYGAQCNGEWEHQYGISIGNIDNPGWCLKVDLTNTISQAAEFTEVNFSRSDTDWVVIRKNGNVLEAFGGVYNLEEMVNIFLDWVAN